MRQLSTILHTYAKLELRPGTPEFMAKLFSCLAGRLGPAVDGKTLAMLGWSLAKLGCGDAKVVAGETVGRFIGRLIGRSSSSRGSRCIYAQSGRKPPAQFKNPLSPPPPSCPSELARAAERAADGMTAPQLRQLLWAAATLPIHDWQLIATLSRAASRQVRALLSPSHSLSPLPLSCIQTPPALTT